MTPALGVGIDVAWDRPTPDQIRAYGAVFVCRYLGEDTTGKNLTRGEAEQLSAAGLWIVSNYEYQPGAALRGYAEGKRVAQLADRQHRACGGPADRPIYFSVDIDVTGLADMALVGEYFSGIASVIGVARTGAYAEYDVIRFLFRYGLIRYGWQTYAWSHGLWDDQAQIRQVANGVQLAGHNVDRDTSHAHDFGQWQIGGAMGQVDYSPSTARAIAIGATEYGYVEGTAPSFDDEVATYNLKAVEGRIGNKIDAWGTAIGGKVDGVKSGPAGGQPTDEQVSAAVLVALRDPAVQQGIGAAVAGNLLAAVRALPVATGA